MAKINEKYQLIYGTIEVNENLIDSLQVNDLSKFPENTKIRQIYTNAFEIEIQNKEKLIIYQIPIQCIIEIKGEKKKIQIYSFKHLELVLDKVKDDYPEPYFYSSYNKKNLHVMKNKIDEREFCLEESIEIKNEDQKKSVEKIKNIYKEINEIYFSNINNNNYTYLSPNYNVYFHYFPNDLSNNFIYLTSSERINLQKNFELFLKQEKEMIFPICGPHNIGKTISALIIQKELFLKKNIKSLYINLKYYFSDATKNCEIKTDTLIKECFFFADGDEQLVELYNKFEILNNIKEIFLSLKNFISTKKFKKENFFIIIDQYQAHLDSIDILNLLSEFKIFLLSSINDFDVKENLILTYSDEDEEKIKLLKAREKKIIKYIYYESLLNINKYKSSNLLDKIKEKIQTKDNEKIMTDKLNEKNEFILEILNQFNYFPKYCSSFIYYYDTIYDLLFKEYNNIFLKLWKFEGNKTINVSEIKKIIGENGLLEQKEVLSYNYKAYDKKEYIEILKYIPLKYINYHINENGKMYFYYSFPLLKQIIDDFNNFFDSQKNFLTASDGGVKGNYFEKIVVFVLRVFNLLNIDGHLEVVEIEKMNFTDNYKLFDKNYIKGKKNILITQSKSEGKSFDFAIYKPESKELILFQSKYRIINYLVSYRNDYIKPSENIFKIFQKIFNDDSKETIKVYLLYVSSIDYNIEQKLEVKNILDRKNITCLFYSVLNSIFSFNFKDPIKDLICQDSFLIYPGSGCFKGQGIEIEEKKRKFTPLSFGDIVLSKKTKRSYNCQQIFRDIKDYFISKKIQFEIDKLSEINSLFDDNIKFNKINEYVILFFLTFDDDSKVDFQKPIGLIYYKEEKANYIEINSNKSFKNPEALLKLFPENCYYGIGDKKKFK